MNAQPLLDVLEEIVDAFVRTARHGLRLVRRMSPRALLGAALVLALVVAVLPLALLLFAFFMVLKVAVGASVIGGRRQRRRAHQSHPHDQGREHGR